MATLTSAARSALGGGKQTRVQALIMDKGVFTEAEARRWAEEHGFRAGDLRTTEGSYIFTQFPENSCVENGLDNGETFSAIELDTGVLGRICKPRQDGANGTGVRERRTAEFSGWGGRTIKLDAGSRAVKDIPDEALALIQHFALVPVKPEDIRVYHARVANNQVDRDQERFHEKILQDFTASLVGKSVLIGHHWGPPGIGRVFKAAIEQDERSWLWLGADFYVPRFGNEQLLHNIDLGVASYVSIGFFAPDRIDVLGAGGDVLWGEYRRGPNGEHGEAIEMSLVFLGSQHDAAVVKSVLGQLEPKLRRAETFRALERQLCPPGYVPGGDGQCHLAGARGEQKPVIPPGPDGRCPPGYVMRDDGMCHLPDKGPKEVLPFSVHGVLPRAPRDRPWDPDAALVRVRQWASADGSGSAASIEFARFAQAFAWVDPAGIATLGGYDWLHHDVEGGQLVHHLEGAVRAMAHLASRAGGLPETEERWIWEHLAEEYRAFGEEPPALEALSQVRARLAAEGADREAIMGECDGLCARPQPKSAVARFWAAMAEVAGKVFAPSAQVGEAALGGPQNTQEDKEDEMDQRVVDELKGLLLTLQQKVEGFGPALTELKAEIASLAGKVGEAGEAMAGAAEDIKVLGDSTEKMLERIEQLEVLAGGAKGEAEEEPPAGGTRKAGEKKTAREVFGRAIIPAELAGVRG